MRTNHVRAKLKRGEPSIGTWLVLSDPLAARMMATTGFDWLTVDLEHGGTTLETAVECFALIAGNGPAPLVRVPVNSVENIKRVLDSGAWGIVVPMVNSRAEAEAVVAAARYAPIGQRSIGGQMPVINFATDSATYLARANEEILVVVMAEHARAIEAIDDILSVPGIDAVFIGPNDLLHSYGKSPSFESEDPAFVNALSRVLTSAKKHGIAAGIHVADAAAAKRRIAEGFQFIAIASEARFMTATAAEIAASFGLAGTTAVKY